jgi:hypothetical protein
MSTIEAKYARILPPPEGIYSSPDSLETYLTGIQDRLEPYRIRKEQKAYWQFAITQLSEHRDQARELEAPEIIAELEALIKEFEKRLSETPIEARNGTHLNTAVVVSSPSTVLKSAHSSTLPFVVVPPPPSVEPEPLSEEERAVVLAALRTELDTVTNWWKEIEKEGLAYENGDWDYPRCFRLRALACTLARLQVEARQSGLEPDIKSDVQRLRGSMEMAREILGDRAACPPFQEYYWSAARISLTPDKWREMEQQYLHTANAHEIWIWYCQHWEGLTLETRIALLNSVAAVQQHLYRILDVIGGRDKLQTDFFIDLREEARETGYLNALNQTTSDGELRHLSEQLSARVEEAQQEWQLHLDKAAQLERKSQKEATVQAVVDMMKRCPDLGQAPDALEEDRAALFPLLDACLALSVPPTNVQIRNCLLEVGPRLLESEPRFAKIREAILSHRQKLGMDPPEVPVEITEEADEEEPTDAALAEYMEAVAPYMAGKRVIILGGTPRKHTCEKLKETLGCAEVKWPPSKESDKSAKFETDVRKSDILLLLIQFASHDMCDRSREWTRESGGQCINIRKGYGVNQLIRHLYEHVRSGEPRR